MASRPVKSVLRGLAPLASSVLTISRSPRPAAIIGGVVQWRVAKLVGDVEPGAAFDQNRGDREIAVDRGDMQPGAGFLIGLVRVAAAGDQLTHLVHIVLG